MRNRTKKVGRNEPCPCGSGNKYKKCCFGKIDQQIAEQKKTFIPHWPETVSILEAHDFLFKNKKEILNELFETGEINELSFDYFKSDEFKDFYFNEIELARCFNELEISKGFKYNIDDTEEIVHYLKEALNLLMTEDKENKIIWYLYNKLPILIRRREYKKGWVILSAVESIKDFKNKQDEFINPCLFHMFIRGMQNMRDKSKSMLVDILGSTGMLDKITFTGDSNIPENVIDMLEQSKNDGKFKEAVKIYFNKNPEIKAEVEALFDEAYLQTSILSAETETRFIYFTKEELMPEIMEMDRFGKQMEGTDIRLKEKEMEAKLMGCIEGAMGRLVTEEKIKRINAFLKNLQDEARDRRDYYKLCKIDIAITVMQEEPYKNPFLFGLIFHSLKYIINQLVLENN